MIHKLYVCVCMYVCIHRNIHAYIDTESCDISSHISSNYITFNEETLSFSGLIWSGTAATTINMTARVMNGLD